MAYSQNLVKDNEALMEESDLGGNTQESPCVQCCGYGLSVLVLSPGEVSGWDLIPSLPVGYLAKLLAFSHKWMVLVTIWW